MVRSGRDARTASWSGGIGRFWQKVIDWQPVDAATFPEFTTPGYGKIAMGIRVDPVGSGRSCITYEARTQLTDDAVAGQVRPVLEAGLALCRPHHARPC